MTARRRALRDDPERLAQVHRRQRVAGSTFRPHAEEHCEATRLEAWAATAVAAILRDAATPAPQDEGGHKMLGGNAMTIHRRRFLQIAAGAAALPAAPHIAHAQAYPARPVRFFVGFPPGGTNDIVGRIVAGMASRAARPAVR